jgi:glycosyltransferase involved in cell wall biosynthesis
MSLSAETEQQTVRVLFVAYSFPPDAEVGAKRVARLCRYLPEYGVRPVVLTAEEQFYGSTDQSYAIPDGVEVCRAPVRTGVLDWYRARKMRRQSVHSSNASAERSKGDRSGRDVLRPIKEYVSTLVKPPNHQPGWYAPAVEEGLRLLRSSNDFAAIVSSGPPWTSHTVARELKRESGLPWIADFRDAWTFNPWRPGLPRWRWKLEERMERSIVTDADRVVSVVDLISDDFRSTYATLPSAKFVTITNGFEGPQVATAPVPRGDRLTFLHLGSLAFDRRIENFCRAVRTLVDANLIDRDKTKVLFVGSISPACWQRAQSEAPELFESGLIEFRDRVPYDEAQQTLAAADVLLIVLGDNRHVVTAKFYEYISTSKPLVVVARDGALTRLVEELGVGLCADPDDPDDIARQLLRAISLPQRTQEDLNRISARFHFRSLAGQMAAVIREVAGNDPVLRARASGPESN